MAGQAEFSVRWKKGGDLTTFHIDNVTALEVTYNASISNIPTIVYGVWNNFVMDLGTTRTISMSCSRVTPDDYDDRSSDPSRWSNGKWWEGFMHMWDNWQNLSYEQDGSGWRIQGGLDFHYIPDSGDPGEDASELIPAIDTNVFLTGSISPRFGVQQMTWSMNLLEARVFSEESAGDRVTLTFKANSSDEGFTRSYPAGTQAYLPNPTMAQSAMVTNGGAITGWRNGSMTYDLGSKVIISDSMDGAVFYAVVSDPVAVYARFLARDAPDIIVPAGCTRARIVAVGAGGKAGAMYGEYYPGGAGGSGEAVSKLVSGLSQGDAVKVQLGMGMFKVDRSKDTSVSVLKITGKSLGTMTAHGGDDGDAANPGNKGGVGGSRYNAGGGTVQGIAHDGSGSVGIPGKAGVPIDKPQRDDPFPGSGGGAADVNMRVTVGALKASEELTTDPSISFEWNHGQVLHSHNKWYASTNIDVESVKDDLLYPITRFKATIIEEGPYWYLIEISDNSVGNKRLYKGGSGIYVSDTSNDSRTIQIVSKGGNGKVPGNMYEWGKGYRDDGGAIGGGAGSGGECGDYAGDGAVIVSFLKRYHAHARIRRDRDRYGDHHELFRELQQVRIEVPDSQQVHARHVRHRDLQQQRDHVRLRAQVSRFAGRQRHRQHRLVHAQMGGGDGSGDGPLAGGDRRVHAEIQPRPRAAGDAQQGDQRICEVVLVQVQGRGRAVRVRFRDVLHGDDALQVQEDETMANSYYSPIRVGEPFSDTRKIYYSGIKTILKEPYLSSQSDTKGMSYSIGSKVYDEAGGDVSYTVSISGTPTSTGIAKFIFILEYTSQEGEYTEGDDNFGYEVIDQDDPMPVSSLTLVGDKNIYVGSTRSFNITVFPTDAANKKLNISITSGAEHCEFSQTGDTTCQVTGVSAGYSTLYAEATDGSNVSLSWRLTIKEQSSGSQTHVITLDPCGGRMVVGNLSYNYTNGVNIWYEGMPRCVKDPEVVNGQLCTYTFKGWCLTEDGTGDYLITGNRYQFSSDITAYAQYESSFKNLYGDDDISSEGNGAWSQPISRSRFRVQMSDSTGSDYFDLMYTDDKGRTRSCISSMKIVGGPEEPFEMVQLVIPKKRLYYVASQLAEANGILAGVTKVVLNDALGRGVFTVTKCKYSGKRFTITAYCDAERFRGSTIQGGSLTGTPRSILATILATRADYGIQVSYLDMDPASRTSNEYDGVLTFEQDTNLWYALQVCAMLMGCRIWFADDTMHVRNCTRRVLNRVSDGAEDLDLYPSSESDPMYGRTAGEVELGDEGADTVVNSVSVRCSYLNPETGEGRGSYNMGPYYENGGDRESSSSVAKFGERTEALTIPELTYTVDTNEETGISTRASEAAEAFARNYIEYLKEPQQSITFELKEVQRTADGKGYEWFPYFDEPTMLDTLTDEPDEIVLTNGSVCGSGTLPQKLMLSSHTRRYPECTTTYSFGIMKSVSLSDSTSRILDALNKG